MEDKRMRNELTVFENEKFGKVRVIIEILKCLWI